MAKIIEKIQQYAGVIGKIFNTMAMDSDADAPSINAVKSVLSNPNLLINGDCQIWQEGDNFNNFANTYTADMWLVMQATSRTTTVSKSIDVPKNQPFRYSLKIMDTTLNNAFLRQHIEVPLKTGVTYTLSFWIKTHTDFNSRILPTEGGTGLDKMFNSTNGLWKRVNWTFTCANDMRGIGVLDRFSGEAYITGIKLEIGEIATAFVSKSYQEELLNCQRYFLKLEDLIAVQFYSEPSATMFQYMLPIPMRINPTIIIQKFNICKITGESLNQKTINTSASTPNRLRYTISHDTTTEYKRYGAVSATLDARIY